MIEIIYKWMSGWHFDILSSFITLVIVPLLIFAVNIFMKAFKSWILYYLEGVIYITGKVIRKSIALSLTLKKYSRLQLGNDRYRYLYIPSRLNINNIDINEIFIPLSVDSLGINKIKYNNEDIISIGNRVMIVGDPGSGKTTLLKKIFRDICNNIIKGEKKILFPIMIELRNVPFPKKNDSNEKKWLYSYIKNQISNNDVYQIIEAFEVYAKSEGLIIMLDGLDEISSDMYPVVEKSINDLAEHLSSLSEKNKVIVTMRTQYFHQIKNDFYNSFPVVAQINPFNNGDIYKFIEKWPYKKNNEKIYKDLMDRPTLKEMCRNPLVLSMYVAELQASGNTDVPETRTEFYKKVTEELLIRRFSIKTGKSQSIRLLKEQRERVLGEIALKHMLDFTQPINVLKWKDAVEVIKKVYRCDEAKAVTIFHEIAKETGLISAEKPEETFRFIHLTFCEFIAANQAIEGEKLGWEELLQAQEEIKNNKNKFLSSRLIEVLPFACGLIPRMRKTDAINEMNKVSDYRLMSRCFLETKSYDHEKWKSFVEEFSEYLLNVQNDKHDAEWLNDLYLFYVIISDANESTKHLGKEIYVFDINKYIARLKEKDGVSIINVLKSYALQDSVAAFRMAEILGINIQEECPELVVMSLDQIPMLAFVKNKIINAYKDSEKWLLLIFESAMHSDVVRKLIRSEMIGKEFTLTEIQKKYYNIYKKILGPNLLSLSLSVASQTRLDYVKKLKYVTIIKNIKRPINIVNVIFPYAILLLVILLFSALNVFDKSKSNINLLGFSLNSTNIEDLSVFLMMVFFLTTTIFILFLTIYYMRWLMIFYKLESISLASRLYFAKNNFFFLKKLNNQIDIINEMRSREYSSL